MVTYKCAISPFQWYSGWTAIFGTPTVWSNVFSRPPASWNQTGQGEILTSTASPPQLDSWLSEHGPRELELLFRAIVFYPSAPIFLADDDRFCREASVGASKLLGVPRE